MIVRRCLGCMKEIGDEERCPYCGFSKNDKVALNLLQPKTVLHQRYVIGKCMWQDGEGITYIAFDATISTPVTIREYMPSTLVQRVNEVLEVNEGCEAQYKALMSDFLDLYQQLTMLSVLPNVLHVYEVFEQNNTVYAVCEHVEALSFNQYLKDNAGDLTWDQASVLFKPMLESLAVIHSKGLIHRGISPDTLLVMKNNKMKLTGFSICSLRVASSEIKSGLFDGYAAPEQYNKMSPHGEWTDVYGICAVLYKALTGTMPPVATTRAVNDNLVKPSVLNTSVPEWASNVIMSGLNYQYASRTQGIRLLYDRLYQVRSFDANTVIMSSSEIKAAAAAYDRDPQQDDREGSGKHGKKSKKGKNKEEESRMSLWLKVVLISLPVVIVVSLFLYATMIGFGGKEKNNANQSSMDSLESSDLLSESSSAKAQSSETSSKESSSAAGKQYVVDEFVGKTYEDIAGSTDYNKIYKINPPTYEYDDTVPNGVIMEQSLKAGDMVTQGQKIIFKVSRGPQSVTLPSTSGKTAEEYRDDLLKYDITATIVSEPSDTVQKGYIIMISPGEGSSIDRENKQSVTIYASKGSVNE